MARSSIPKRLLPGQRTVVCGAGPAGLTAAYALARRGHRVTVLESDDVVGGLSRTVTYGDYRFDVGGHRFFTKSRVVEDLWREVLGEDLTEVARLSRIHFEGTFFDYPLRAGDALRRLGLRRALAIVASYAKARLDPSPVEENFEQWVSNRFGTRLYETFFKTYTEKIWGIPCTEIRAEWAAQRIKGLSLATAILSSASLSKRSTKIKSLIHSFRYPRLGPGQMWEAFRDRIVEQGGSVLLGHRVTSIEVREGEAKAVIARTLEGERRFEADHVVSSMALRDLVPCLQPAPAPAVVAAAEGLRYRAFVLAALILDTEEVFPDTWIYIHTPGVRVGRIQNFGNWSKDMVPVAGRTCLGMEYFCFEGEELWRASDGEMIDLATRELEALDLAPGVRVLDGAVVRAPKAYPIYDAMYPTHLSGVRDHLAGVANLHTVGRNGMHKYNNQDHSMLTGLLTVENMLGASHDVWSMNTDFEYQEEQRLEPEPPGPGRLAAAAGERAR